MGDRMVEMTKLDGAALAVAATRLGVDAAAVASAVAAYREACLHVAEPAWNALCHMSGEGASVSTFVAVGTDVVMSIRTVRGRTGDVHETRYGFKAAPFETYAEAAAFEVRWKTAVERRDEATLDALCAVLDAHA